MIIKLKFLLLLILIPLVSISQTKPKIGLVLSGGGAKGIAHLGMLHALDSLNIKPDFITGTSMGSIMGALYAIGYSADEIDVIISEGDWDYVLSDDIPLNDIETTKKHTYQRSLLHFNFSDNLIPKLPAGIVYGQHISEYFSKLTWRVANVKDFNNFEIPFKCVSADLISGKPYFFDHGDLSTAMRSSMSIPTVFSPIKIDTLLLVDGGVYRNFPVIDVIEMGGEKIIGSYTGFEQTTTFEKMQSLTSVLIRSSTFAGIQDIEKQEELCDYYIKYDLYGLGAKDFKKAKEIINYGKSDISNSTILDSLVALSKVLARFPKNERTIIPERDSILIGGIKTEGLSMMSKEYMISKSGLELGQKISKDDMTIALNNMMGTLLFNKITYTLSKAPNSTNKDSFIINFDVVEKTRGEIQVSLNYDNFFGPSISTVFLVRNIIFSGSLAQLRINLSENPMIHTNYDIFWGKKKRIQTSLLAKYEVLKIKSFFDFGDDLGSLNIGSHITKNAEFSIKTAYNFNTNNQIGVNFDYQITALKFIDGSGQAMGIDNISELGSAMNIYFKHNNLNKQFYPTKGFDLYVSSRIGSPYTRNEVYTSSDTTIYKGSFIQLELKYKHLIKIGNHVSLQPSFAIGLSSNEPSNINKFMLGGYTRQQRINNINMIGAIPYFFYSDSYIMINLDLQYKIIDNLYLTLLTNATSFSNINIITGKNGDNENFGAGLTLGYLSPFGPIDAGFSINNTGVNYWHINIGFPF